MDGRVKTGVELISNRQRAEGEELARKERERKGWIVRGELQL